MEGSKFTEEQIAFALKQAESGITVAEVCRKMGVSENTLLCLEKEVFRTRRIRAEAATATRRGESQTQAVGSGSEPGQGDVAGRAVKKVVKPAGMRQLVLRLQEGYRVSERRAVKALGAHRSAIRYRPKRPVLDAPIRKRIEEIAAVRIRYGYRRIHTLLQREGWSVNLKRVYRIYCLAGLNLRRERPKRSRMASHRIARPDVTKPNDCWTMDFVSDALFNGKRFRALTVMDQFTRERLAGVSPLP